MRKLITSLFLFFLFTPTFLFGQKTYDYLEGYIHASQHYDAYRYSDAILLYNELINNPTIWKEFSTVRQLEIYQKTINSYLKKQSQYNQNDFNHAIILANQSVNLVENIYLENNEELTEQITKYYIKISFPIAKYDLNLAMGFLLQGAQQTKNDKYAKILLGKLDDILRNEKNPIQLKVDIVQKIDISIALRKERGLESFSAFVTLGMACCKRNLNTTAAICYQEAILVSKSSKNTTKLIRDYYLKNLKKLEIDRQFEMSKDAILFANQVGKLNSECAMVLAIYFNNSENFKNESLFFFQKSFELAKNVEDIIFLFIKGRAKGEYSQFITRMDTGAFEVAKKNSEIMEENGIVDITIYKVLIQIFKDKEDKEAFMFFSEKKKSLQFEQGKSNQIDLKKLAFSYFENQNYRKAKEKFHAALKYEGQFALTYHWLIKCNINLNEKERANNNLNQMVRTADFVTYFPEIENEWNSILTFLGINRKGMLINTFIKQ